MVRITFFLQQELHTNGKLFAPVTYINIRIDWDNKYRILSSNLKEMATVWKMILHFYPLLLKWNIKLTLDNRLGFLFLALFRASSPIA